MYYTGLSPNLLPVLKEHQGGDGLYAVLHGQCLLFIYIYFHGDVEQVVRQYYERSWRMVELGGFDIVGHADKVHYNASFCCPGIVDEPWYDRLVCDYFAEIARRGYQMEINTKAYGELGVFYPDERYFPLLRELGIRVQVNSDAHYPERISNGMPEAFRALQNAGFTSVMQLRAGQWAEVPIV